MFAVAPAHVVIPAGAVIGSTLKPDGSIEVYGADAMPFPSEVIVGDGGETQTGGGLDGVENGQKQWLIGSDGRLLSKTALDAAAGSANRGAYAVSSDGAWFVGLKSATAVGEQGSIVVWRRGSTDLIPVSVSADQTGGPMARGISNDGDVIYMAYVGDDLRGFAWDRTSGLLPLESLYAVEGNASPEASLVRLEAISDDGRTIVGGNGGGELPMRATVSVDGVPRALPADNQTPS
jgi:hypothetical protein